MHRSYRYLRYRHASICALNHVLPSLRIAAQVDLAVAYTFRVSNVLAAEQ
jgi:hypothetical protein